MVSNNQMNKRNIRAVLDKKVHLKYFMLAQVSLRLMQFTVDRFLGTHLSTFYPRKSSCITLSIVELHVTST